MIYLTRVLFLLYLIISNPLDANSAEILQINSSKSILVGDQNRDLPIVLYCVDIEDKNERKAISLLKKEFPRGSKVKIKPFGFEDKILVAKVFDINETKEMSDLLIKNELMEETCS